MLSLYLLLPLSVSGGDVGGEATASVELATRGRGASEIPIFIEAPTRRPHTNPHVNWLLTPHIFLDVTVDAHTRQCHRDGRDVSDRQTLTPLCNWPTYDSLTQR